MLRSTTLTVISGGALGVDLEAEKLARHYDLNVEVLIPPLPPLVACFTRHWLAPEAKCSIICSDNSSKNISSAIGKVLNHSLA